MKYSTNNYTKIGFAHGLLSYRYCLWKEFFKQLGFTVIESVRTTTSIMKKGISLTVDDTCMPVKAFIGHVDELLSKDIDYLFVPRVLTIRRISGYYYTCPKIIALPDVVRAIFNLSENTTPKILEMEIDERKERMESRMIYFARKDLRKGKRDVKNAISVSIKKQREYEKMLSMKDDHRNYNLKIAVVGHPYLIFDDYLSIGLIRKLNELDVEVITQFIVPEKEIEKSMEGFFEISWGYEREILGSISYFTNIPAVDGIIYFTSFGCGPFAVLSELVIREIKNKSSKPIMFLMIDELTGETGFITRIESFVDMIRAQK